MQNFKSSSFSERRLINFFLIELNVNARNGHHSRPPQRGRKWIANWVQPNKWKSCMGNYDQNLEWKRKKPNQPTTVVLFDQCLLNDFWKVNPIRISSAFEYITCMMDAQNITNEDQIVNQNHSHHIYACTFYYFWWLITRVFIAHFVYLYIYLFA